MLFVDWKKEPFEKKVAFMKNVKEQFTKEGSASNAGLANLHLAAFYEETERYETALKYVLENKALLEEGKDVIKIYINAKQTLQAVEKRQGGHRKQSQWRIICLLLRIVF